jgi:hypothetical protein
MIARQIVPENEVWVTSGYNVGCSLHEISHQNGKPATKEVYANKNMKNHHGGCILLNGYIYGSNDPGILTCLDFQTGQAKWKDVQRDAREGRALVLSELRGNNHFRQGA